MNAPTSAGFQPSTGGDPHQLLGDLLPHLLPGYVHRLKNRILGLHTGLKVMGHSLSSGDPLQEDLRACMEEVEELRALVEELKTVSGTGRILPQPLELSPVIHHLVDVLHHHTPRQVTWKEPGSLSPVLGTPGRVRRLVGTLLLSAFDAAGDEGDVGICLEEGPGEAPSRVILALETRDGKGSPQTMIPGQRVWNEVFAMGGEMEASSTRVVLRLPRG